MTEYPKWVLKFKAKGKEIRLINNHYYLYNRSSRWDPKKKRAKKITGEYLGTITQEGLVPPKHKTVLERIKEVTVKEYGAAVLINKMTKDMRGQLEKIYPDDWQSILSFAILRFFHNSPMKNLFTHFIHSHISDLFPDSNLDPKAASDLVRLLGSDRARMIEFMKKLNPGNENLIIDLTHVFSYSKNITWLSIGHNSKKEFHPQINVLLLFSNDTMMPIFFRLLVGSIRDVSSVKATIAESEITNAVFVGDKGFYSKSNVGSFENAEIQYILPLKRNSSLINYKVMMSSDRRAFDGYFFFEKRHIWYKESKVGKRRIVLFFDEKLRVEEHKNFLERVNEEQKSINEFYKNQYRGGTITIITNTKFSCEKIYYYLKSRNNVEVAFDAFKNILEADKTYMRTDMHLYGWMFVNFISLLLYYNIYGILIKNKLIKKYSPKDIVLYFSKVYKVKLANKEIISEIPKTTRYLIEKMKLKPDILRKA